MALKKTTFGGGRQKPLRNPPQVRIRSTAGPFINGRDFEEDGVPQVEVTKDLNGNVTTDPDTIPYTMS